MKETNIPDDDETIRVSDVLFTHKDIHSVVDDFYARIQLDPILKEPFSSVGDWPHHIQGLTHFWWVRFGGEPYLLRSYNPVAKHFVAGFSRELLTRWLQVFHETLRAHLNSDQAQFWKVMSERMGESLLMRNDFLKSQSVAVTGDTD